MSSQQASTFLKLTPQETIIDEWEVLHDDGGVGLGDVIAICLGFIFLIIPGLIVLFQVITRPRRKGLLCVTNWRCLYYESGAGWYKNYHRVDSADLDDIVAVRSHYNEQLLGTRTLSISLLTRFDDSIVISIGDYKGLLSKIPIFKKLAERNSIGKDALRVPPILYRLVQERRAASSESTAF